MTMRELHDSTVAIVGLGLMGGSLALALRERNACNKIIGITRDPSTRERAMTRGILDAASADLSLASEADVIVLATPVRTIIEQMPRVGEIARDGAILIDLGSTKREIVRAMEKLPTSLQPMGGHPMCGKEISGFDAAEANLYQNAIFVLTPLARTSPQTISLAEALARTLGARPLILDPERHDRIVAAISHLPFALAATLMTTADEFSRKDDLVYALAASGFRDASRLAASDIEMMLDILLTNSENVAGLMRAYSRHFAELADLIYEQDEKAVQAILQNAATKRQALFRT